MDKILVAIGGGEISGWNFKTKDANQTIYNLEKIDKEIRKLSKKENPKMLFIGTASKENPAYFNAIKNIYENLGCTVENLEIIGNDDKEEILNKVLNQDIIYIGGGNTRYMMSEFDRVNFKDALLKSYNQGIVIAGYSAGAYLMFSTNYEGINGYGLIDAVSIVHYNDKTEEKKKAFFDKVNQEGKFGIALDNCSALVYKNEEMSLIKSKEIAKGYKVEHDKMEEI